MPQYFLCLKLADLSLYSGFLKPSIRCSSYFSLWFCELWITRFMGKQSRNDFILFKSIYKYEVGSSLDPTFSSVPS